MVVRIVCVNKPSGDNMNAHVAISHYGWYCDSNKSSGKGTRIEMVKYIEDGNQAYVSDRLGNKVFCKVRESIYGNKFLQTESDGKYTNNLLELIECI